MQLKKFFSDLLKSGVIISMLISCKPTESISYPDLPQLGVEYNFEKRHMCNGPSPKLIISGVPVSTKTFDIKLKDLKNPQYDHGGGLVDYKGQYIIEEGGVDGYREPCPVAGNLERNLYRFSVKALDSLGQVVGYGEKSVYLGWYDIFE